MANDKIFTANDEATFKKNFATQFLASWVASNYDDFCMRGLQKELRKPPVEDAAHLAQEAWDHLVETVGLKSE